MLPGNQYVCTQFYQIGCSQNVNYKIKEPLKTFYGNIMHLLFVYKICIGFYVLDVNIDPHFPLVM